MAILIAKLGMFQRTLYYARSIDVQPKISASHYIMAWLYITSDVKLIIIVEISLYEFIRFYFFFGAFKRLDYGYVITKRFVKSFWLQSVTQMLSESIT